MMIEKHELDLYKYAFNVMRHQIFKPEYELIWGGIVQRLLELISAQEPANKADREHRAELKMRDPNTIPGQSDLGRY